MNHDSDILSLNELLRPLVAAEDALARLDERLSRKGESTEGRLRDGLMRENEGWITRTHFNEACNALWLAGELVHIEDLVLHDARMDIRTPTHELTKAHSILRTRRQIAGNAPAWALSPQGMASLRGRGGGEAATTRHEAAVEHTEPPETVTQDRESEAETAFNQELAHLDQLLDRTTRMLDAPVAPVAASPPRQGRGDAQRESVTPDGDPLLYDPEWNEEIRLSRWLAVLDQTRALPPLFAAALAWDAWEEIEPLQHQHWLGLLLVAAMLRERGKTKSHLASFHAGLRTIQRERRRSRDRNTRLAGFLEAVHTSSMAGLKEIDRLSLARMQMERKLKDRRSTSSLPGTIDLILSRPMVSTSLIAKELKVTPRAALNLVAELGVREMTGRGRYRAWGIV